jgi:hypothetical protein
MKRLSKLAVPFVVAIGAFAACTDKQENERPLAPTAPAAAITAAEQPAAADTAADTASVSSVCRSVLRERAELRSRMAVAHESSELQSQSTALDAMVDDSCH